MHVTGFPNPLHRGTERHNRQRRKVVIRNIAPGERRSIETAAQSARNAR